MTNTTNAADETNDVEYCRRHPGHLCTAVHIHGQSCAGGVEVPQGDFAWLTPGPWRQLAVELKKESAPAVRYTLHFPVIGEKLAGLVVRRWHTWNTVTRDAGFGKRHQDIIVTFTDGTDEYWTVEYVAQSSVVGGNVGRAAQANINGFGRRAVAGIGLVLSLVLSACATTARPAALEVETVGVLSASASHVMAAAVHATTDLGIAYQAAGDADDDAGDLTAAATTEAETPDVAPKARLVMGSAR